MQLEIGFREKGKCKNRISKIGHRTKVSLFPYLKCGTFRTDQGYKEEMQDKYDHAESNKQTTYDFTF